MFGKRFKIFDLFGFAVYIDLSWVLIAVLVSWSLAQGYFPYFHKGLTQETYWIMGILGALGLFLSIIFHEMSHSLVARSYGLEMRSITLFVFGGVSEMGEEPANPRTEFSMAIAGPLSSIVLGFAFYGIGWAGSRLAWPVSVLAIFSYLSFINIVLAVFNLVPAYPLDGGRMLRSILWSRKNNMRAATRIAARIGGGFGMGLIVLGVLNVVFGNFIGGMWWFLIGLFLRNSAFSSYTQLLMERALKGEPVRNIMNAKPVTVPPSTSLDALVQDYFYRYHFKMFPVQDASGRLQGCVTIDSLKEIPRERWRQTTVEQVESECGAGNTVEASADALKVMARMNREGVSKLLVTDHGELEGIVTLRDLFDFLRIKMDLEGDEDMPGSRGT
ncbi:MAG TPA: site-2 protease family protein [Deltaproteobacteria bacterium]|jgi:Zn-dependent protease|nr:site-2 protease family protein [Deltaproteobacteria bacterium]HOI07787.1 site-2 protease family protein [Deltaproteobacteria bacterium]